MANGLQTVRGDAQTQTQRQTQTQEWTDIETGGSQSVEVTRKATDGTVPRCGTPVK